MVILGIDPGTAILGFGVLDNSSGKLKVIDYGCITTSKDLEMAQRLDILGKEIDNLIERFSPDVMAIEELFYFKNKKTVISVGQARGVAVFIGKKNNLDIREYTPLQVKQSVTGYGRADKKQIQMMVKNILKLKETPKPDDVADALAVAICCSSSIQFERRIENA